MGLMEDAKDSRWYHGIWFVLAMLFFVAGPLALPLLWKSPRFPQWAKIALTVATVVWTVWLLAATIAATHVALRHLQQLQGL